MRKMFSLEKQKRKGKGSLDFPRIFLIKYSYKIFPETGMSHPSSKCFGRTIFFLICGIILQPFIFTFHNCPLITVQTESVSPVY